MQINWNNTYRHIWGKKCNWKMPIIVNNWKWCELFPFVHASVNCCYYSIVLEIFSGNKTSFRLFVVFNLSFMAYERH